MRDYTRFSRCRLKPYSDARVLSGRGRLITMTEIARGPRADPSIAFDLAISIRRFARYGRVITPSVSNIRVMCLLLSCVKVQIISLTFFNPIEFVIISLVFLIERSVYFRSLEELYVSIILKLFESKT